MVIQVVIRLTLYIDQVGVNPIMFYDAFENRKNWKQNRKFQAITRQETEKGSTPTTRHGIDNTVSFIPSSVLVSSMCLNVIQSASRLYN